MTVASKQQQTVKPCLVSEANEVSGAAILALDAQLAATGDLGPDDAIDVCSMLTQRTRESAQCTAVAQQLRACHP